MKYFYIFFCGVIFFLISCSKKSSTPIAGEERLDIPEESAIHIDNDTVIAAVMPPTLVRIAANESSSTGIGISQIKGLLSEKEALVFAANGGMYDTDYRPVGLCVINGETVKQVAQFGGEGNFNLKFGDQPTNGIFLIDKSNRASVIPSIKYDNSHSSVSYATQSGPLLLLDGMVNPIFKQGSQNLNYRNGVGIDNNGNVVLVMTNKPINFYDFACLFRDRFQCTEALYLDGVVSRTFCPAEGYNMDGSSFGVIIYVTSYK